MRIIYKKSRKNLWLWSWFWFLWQGIIKYLIEWKKGIIKYSGYLLQKNVHATYMINKGGDCGEKKNFKTIEFVAIIVNQYK